jgi:hypothetical protein
MLAQIKIGSEWHTTERRGAMVEVNGVPIYKALKPIGKPQWEMIGNKGKHGKWCVAFYDIPIGSRVQFVATANNKDGINESFVVSENTDIDIEGYQYGSDICGWVVMPVDLPKNA